MTLGEIKMYPAKYDDMQVTLHPKVTAADELYVEYNYVGFLGYRVNIFLWHGRKLIGIIHPDKKGNFVLKPTNQPKELEPETRMYRFWLWLYKNIPIWLENL